MTRVPGRTISHLAGGRRLANRLEDVDVVERAGQLIGEVGVRLERQLEGERRPAERARMLREAMNRITRATNDALQAYVRTSRGIRAELERPDADVAAAHRLRTRLDTARAEVLTALEAARKRYGAPTAPAPSPANPSRATASAEQ
ncbi:MAG TPA: hypothetical protein VFI80_06505 [Burkholderiales bacterium]|nr:hypothetical protein [Burkholderiales bacterium]